MGDTIDGWIWEQRPTMKKKFVTALILGAGAAFVGHAVLST